MPSKISEIISSLPGTSAAPTGASTGNGGAGRQLTANPDASRAWLASQRPDTVDARIRASLKSQLGVSVNVKLKWMFPESQKSYQVPTSVGLTGLSTESLSAALAKVDAGFTPLTRDQAEQAMAQMDAVLSRRGGRDDDTATVVMDVFVNVLLSHPADVAVEAVRYFTFEPRKDGGVAWFPTPPELEAHCRVLSADRVALRTALRSWKPVSDAQAEVGRLEGEHRRLRAEASRLETKIGPGPATDTGARGERIEAASLASEKASAAKQAWIEAQKALDVS